MVDDSPDLHRLVKARLKGEPAEFLAVTTGEEGIAKAAELLPAAILLDLDMPPPDGFAVLRAIKDDPRTVHIPVIVLSGKEGSHDKATAFELGAQDYVTKPFDFVEMRARLRAALRLSSLVRLLSERAEVDGLTGLPNRAAFNRRWETEVQENLRIGRPLSLAMFDIDHFKKINDTFGHPAGDEVLQEFARLVSSSIRSTDVVCRFGGEEFAAILPQATPEEARNVCERIRQRLSDQVFNKMPEHKVTVSIGLASAARQVPGATAEGWLEFADKALYSAKRGGRNRMEVTSIDEGTFAGNRPPLKKAG